MEETRFVGKGIVKKDAEALLSGKPVYTMIWRRITA